MSATRLSGFLFLLLRLHVVVFPFALGGVISTVLFLPQPKRRNQFSHALLLEVEQILLDTRVVLFPLRAVFERERLPESFFSPDLCRLSSL